MITLSRNGVLVSIYRFFKNRQFALKGASIIERRMLTESLKPGAKLDLCPVIRMMLWGPFLVLPAWLTVFVLLPACMTLVILAGVGLVSFGAYSAWAKVGFDLWFGLKALAFLVAGVIIAAICVAAILFVAFLIVKALSSMRDFVEYRLPQRSRRRYVRERKPRQRSETLEALALWWEGLHEKFCAIVQIR